MNVNQTNIDDYQKLFVFESGRGLWRCGESLQNKLLEIYKFGGIHVTEVIIVLQHGFTCKYQCVLSLQQLFLNYLMKVLRHISQYWLVYLQLFLCVNSFYVSTIDFKHDSSSLFFFVFTCFIHIMYLYSMYCSCIVSTAPRNQTQKAQSSYCRKCQQDVYVRDHHCIFIGQCAAKHNYKHFFSYVFYSYLMATNNTYCTYWHWKQSEFSAFGMLRYYSWDFLARIFVFFGSGLWFAVFTGQLLAYQVYMILNGITAREHKKQSEPLKYTFKTVVQSLFNSQKRAEMIKNFKDRWSYFFISRYEFFFCELQN